MTVRALQKNRIFGAILSRSSRVGNCWRFPKRLDPTATGDPFAGFGLRDARFYFGEKIFARVCPLEI